MKLLLPMKNSAKLIEQNDIKMLDHCVDVTGRKQDNSCENLSKYYFVPKNKTGLTKFLY